MRNIVVPSKIFIIVLVIFINSVISQLNTKCVTPNDEEATCIRLNACKVIYDAVRTQSQSAISFAQQSSCGHSGNVPLVCCGSTGYPGEKAVLTDDELFGLFPKGSKPTATKAPKSVPEIERLESYDTKALPDRTLCGIDRESSRIFGGEETKIDEYTWMAALEFKRKRNGEDVGVKCGGSLINQRFVLTAAHCIVHREFKVTKVRLGEWDLSKDPDCIELPSQDECADNVVKVDVEEEIPHPYYSSTNNNDIALVKLAKDVQYSEYIRPICLPPKNLPSASYNTYMTVAGWGLTENDATSEIKLKVNVPLLPNENCLQKLKNKPIGVNQLCAGGEYGKDTCQGDSGGPLMRPYDDPQSGQTNWYQEGVVSYGLGCARQGAPAVYTRLDRYIVWIINIIEDDAKRR